MRAYISLMTNSEASKLLTAALKNVQSDSIRGWARAQRPVWVKIIRQGCGTIAGVPVFQCAEGERAERLATFIVCTAIGL
jgi:hypothetical protein